MVTPTYRANVTDTEQNQVESAQFDSGVPVFEDAETRIIMRNEGGAAQVASGQKLASNAGVLMPWDDRPGTLADYIPGKRQ